MDKEKIKAFIKYAKILVGDEKGEAQVFCDRLFQAFEHDGYKEAGATLEHRVKTKKSTTFADLLWGDRVLIEMKKRGEKLEKHLTQLKNYWWGLRPKPPKYSILCNFDEFYIYDFLIQDEPLDKIKLENLENRITALNFLYPKPKKPIFENNIEEVTRETAYKVAKVFNSLIQRKEDRAYAQKFILQSVFAMFAEDYLLLPDGFFTSLIMECINNDASSYDLLGGLYKQMANPHEAKGGRYKEVQYFNGGLFEEITPIELNKKELQFLLDAAKKDWSKVNPAIFGTIFQSSMDAEERHAYGAHFTSELDIYKVVHPTIIEPWLNKIDKAKTLKDTREILGEIRKFKVLDPACGSGNFLYVAYRELKRLEMEILNNIQTEFPKGAKEIGTSSHVSIKQFHGIDLNEFAIELAKVTLLLAKEVAIKETQNWLTDSQLGIDFEIEEKLPLDNLDDNIIYEDSLFADWIDANVIIGNPPFLGGKYLREERGDKYAEKIYSKFPNAKGQPDYCVFWFQKAHLSVAKRIGLVGTNSISQGVSRDASLNFIVSNGGYITNAISTQVWSGEANVHVSIVNWVKDKNDVPKTLYLDNKKVKIINTSLKNEIDVTDAKKIKENLKKSFQSCELSGKGFIISEEIAKDWIKSDKKNKEVVKPMVDGSSLVNPNSKLEWVIDFNNMSMEDASKFKLPFEHVKENVKPERITNKEKVRREKWWLFGRARPKMRKEFEGLTHYFCLPKVAKYTCFQAIDISILPCEANMVITSDDFFILGVLNSKIHLDWVKAQSSTLEDRTRYTNTTCFETFPFPHNAKENLKEDVRLIMNELEDFRKKEAVERKTTITKFYNDFINEPASKLYKLHKKLDNAVCSCYGWKYNETQNFNKEVLELNEEINEEINKTASGLK